ncbi:MAG: hypothetical protein DI616_04375 [Paracoccus denitrificans]|uniref:DUF3329 domain-containing protein n=1 Tax=Paracoccus denitrificans TaxID=266 RepID=A0A533IAP1_PARDE|nr:MAG: hypothetical protein DI616_04375 [Paracoccus denitrificans]
MLVDPNHPFFRKLWVRILCVVFPFGWAIMEMMNGQIFWAILFAAAGAVLVHALFIVGPDKR